MPTTLSAPLGHINVHIRDGSAILLHSAPAYTVEETRQGPFSLLISQSRDGLAFGTAYLDDGISYPPGPSKIVTFFVTKNKIIIAADGPFVVQPKLSDVTVLGVTTKPSVVSFNGKNIKGWQYLAAQEKLVVAELNGDLNGSGTLQWK